MKFFLIRLIVQYFYSTKSVSNIQYLEIYKEKQKKIKEKIKYLKKNKD